MHQSIHIQPSKEEFRSLAKTGNLIPVYADLMADFETPVSVYSKLQAAGSAFLLESIEGGAHLNRYSFIGAQPRKVIHSKSGGDTVVASRDGGRESFPTPEDPLDVIKQEMSRYKPVRLPNMPRFVGGAVGTIGYEYIHSIEPTVPIPEDDPLGMPTLHFMLADTIVIYDRARQVLRLLTNAHIEADPDSAYEEACEILRDLAVTLAKGREMPTLPVVRTPAPEIPEGNFTQEVFQQMVRNCVEYILAGDAIQIVGSQRFEIPVLSDPLTLYRALRVVNPSPYMFLYNTEEFSLVGASPEVHVRLTDGLAELRPIAGTRPRGVTADMDLAYEKELLADEKERAEHLMLVDLARNDLGRVCEYGSVHVPDYMTIERYSHVMHIVSQVEGRLRNDSDAYGLMRATFPAGTVSGAPKIRAMQIIAEQEKQQRGPYAGAVAYFSYDGNLDSCIAIRTALLKDNKAFIQSGAGLVADSDPTREFEETLNKPKGLLIEHQIAEAMHDHKV